MVRRCGVNNHLDVNTVGLDNEDEEDAHPPTRGRRTTLIASIATTMSMTMMTMSSASSASANPLQALGDARKASNARFIVGPVALSRGRLAALRRDVAYDGTDASVVGDIKERLTSATLDCSTPRESLQAYSNVKDVCTLGILARSVTYGPGANNAPGTEAYTNVYTALETTRGAFTTLEDVLTSTGQNGSDVSSLRDAAFDACDDSLRAFAEALLACFAFDDDADIRNAVPGAFVQ